MTVIGENLTGGFVGRVSSTDNEYNSITADNCLAENLRVSSTHSAGGFTGYIENYNVKLDGMNGVFDEKSITVLYKGGGESDNGTGGLIGQLRKSNNNNVYICEIKNYNIGEYNSSTSVVIGFDPTIAGTGNTDYFEQKTWTDNNTGGLIGYTLKKQ